MQKELEMIDIKIKELKPSKYNPRKNLRKCDEEYQKIKRSIEHFGYVDPIIINHDNTVIGGHQRLKVLKELEYKEIKVVKLNLNKQDEKALNVALNKISGQWDINLLKDLLDELTHEDFDVTLTGFDKDELPDINDISNRYSDYTLGALKSKFIMPPFSILDARQGDWQKRKKVWLKLIDSSQGRNEDLASTGFLSLAKSIGSNLTGTSIFDPVLCEILINWYSPKGGKIIDPFAGGSVRGLVSSFLERDYYGADLSE